MNDKIYPIAYTLTPGLVRPLYYLGFPAAWKAELVEIARANSPRFKDEYGLPTNALKKMVDSWMEGVIALNPLKKDSHDEHWLTSCRAYTERDITMLYHLLKIWVAAAYIVPDKAPLSVKTRARAFCERIRPEELLALRSEAQVCLTAKDGTVAGEAYAALPLLAINRLLGREVTLNGRALHLCYSGKNQLISRPVTDEKSGHAYSFVFNFSVQTTPPDRSALLLCQMSTRRWIPGYYGKDRSPFLAEAVNAHIAVSGDKYCQVPIAYDRRRRQLDWQSQDKECYNICGYEPLPDAVDVLTHPERYAGTVLLPYKNGMGGFVPSKIGTGISVKDKAELYARFGEHLSDLIGAPPEALRVRRKGQTLDTYRSPEEYENREAFRSWVCRCAETDEITFELYGLWKDPVQRETLERLREKLLRDFGEDIVGSCLRVHICEREAGDLADGLADSDPQTQIQRCDAITAALGEANTVTACLFLLQGHGDYCDHGVGDPKQVLRNAFARTGRVVQFVKPEEEADSNKICNAVYDLYRQLGVVALLKPQDKMPPHADVPCVGMHVCTQVTGCAGKGRFLPLCVAVDVRRGRTRVYCDAFSRREVSYREACLEMARLFWQPDLEQHCVEASRSPAKRLLIALKNRFQEPQDSVVLLVQADGTTRSLWGGISDKEIGRYDRSEESCPTQINVGSPQAEYRYPLVGSGVRIIRIRCNQEVPDYYTERSAKSREDHVKYASASGVFRYRKVFWSIHAKPDDPQYNRSLDTSRLDRPAQRFAEKDMIELYPLQLQPGDDAAEWIFYANALRHIPIQYQQSTNLPLPLHLAKALEEYLFRM